MQCDGGLSLPTRLVGFSLLEMQDGWFFLVFLYSLFVLVEDKKFSSSIRKGKKYII
jgi:hypothetical protein